jgi:hypothetical protein
MSLTLVQEAYIVPNRSVLEHVHVHDEIILNVAYPEDHLLVLHVLTLKGGTIVKVILYIGPEGGHRPNFSCEFVHGLKSLQLMLFEDVGELDLLSQVESGKYMDFVAFLRRILSVCGFNPK